MANEPQYVLEARAKIARLYNHGKTPTQSEADAARAGYFTAKADAFIRKSVQQNLKGARLDDNDVAHLVGLIASLGGVKGETVAFIESLVRAAVLEAQQGGE